MFREQDKSYIAGFRPENVTGTIMNTGHDIRIARYDSIGLTCYKVDIASKNLRKPAKSFDLSSRFGYNIFIKFDDMTVRRSS